MLHGVFCLYSSTFNIIKLFIHFCSSPSSLTAPDPTSPTGGPASDCRRWRRGTCSCSDTEIGAAKGAKDHSDPSALAPRGGKSCGFYLPSFLQSCSVMGSLCRSSNSLQKRARFKHTVSPASPPTDLSIHPQPAWKGGSLSTTSPAAGGPGRSTLLGAAAGRVDPSTPARVGCRRRGPGPRPVTCRRQTRTAGLQLWGFLPFLSAGSSTSSISLQL